MIIQLLDWGGSPLKFISISTMNYCRRCGDEIKNPDLRCWECRRLVEEDLEWKIDRPIRFYFAFYHTLYKYATEYKETCNQDRLMTRESSCDELSNYRKSKKTACKSNNKPTSSVPMKSFYWKRTLTRW